jgi:uncharacterized tellurite resistance protein B-like protein
MILTRLYFMLINADGKVDEKEIVAAKQMVRAEGMNEHDFRQQMITLRSYDQDALFVETLSGMKNLEQNEQVRIIAWLCVVANSDGFMDRTEWQLIYRIYHKELGLPLHDIFEVQKKLNRINDESSLTIL